MAVVLAGLMWLFAYVHYTELESTDKTASYVVGLLLAVGAVVYAWFTGVRG